MKKTEPVAAKRPPALVTGGRCLLHWEITRKCAVGCKFCYRGKDIPPRDLSYRECLSILSSFREFLEEQYFTGSIIFSGGHPLLRDDFIDILKVAHQYQKDGIIGQMSISGNPDRVNDRMVATLKRYGVSVYQLSIDGLETTHDYFRRPGSFRQTVAALKCLKKGGLKDSVKFTLSRINARELVETMRLLINEGISFVHFSQLVPVGEGKNLENEVLTPAEYRTVLVDVLKFLETLPSQNNGFKESIFCNEPLYGRLFYELGRWDEYRNFMSLPQPLTACGTGLVFSVLPDGEVRIRRFIPVKIGHLPRDSFRKIYENSDFVRSLEDEKYMARKKSAYPKCRDCPVMSRCGNMVADAYYFTGDPAAPNPKCWAR